MTRRKLPYKKPTAEGSNSGLSDRIQAKHIWSVVIGIYIVLFVVIGYLECRDNTIYKAFKERENVKSETGMKKTGYGIRDTEESAKFIR